MQHAAKRLTEHVIIYSYVDGLKKFPQDLVDSFANDSDVWDRCGSMSSLTIQEQIQQLDYFCRWRALLEFLHRHDSALRNELLMNEHVTRRSQDSGITPDKPIEGRKGDWQAETQAKKQIKRRSENK